MSMSTHVVGFRPADKDFNKMLAVYDACKKAQIAVPDEVQEFFDWEEPCTWGATVNIDAACSQYNGESQDGYDIHLDKLPSGLKVVRVYNSY